jgi:hypothetical protein
VPAVRVGGSFVSVRDVLRSNLSCEVWVSGGSSGSVLLIRIGPSTRLFDCGTRTAP